MAVPKFKLLNSNIAGFDTILGGGIPAGSLMMVVGSPGTGKTLLLHQLCFSVAKDYSNTIPSSMPPADQSQPSSSLIPAKALYFSTLSEPHEKVLQHIGQFSFYDETLLNSHIRLYSLTGAMQQGLDQVISTILDTVRQEKPKLVAIDGFAALEALEDGPLAIRRVLYRLSGQLGVLGITAVIALERNLPSEGGAQSSEELTIGDGVIYLSSHLEGVRTIRQAEVRKLRGMNNMLGLHHYQITLDGLIFYPRLEALTDPSLLSGSSVSDERRLGMGMPELEKMLNGGLPVGSSTVLAGSPGTGKTLFNLHYLLAGAQQKEAGLYLGFYEGKDQLLKKARQFGLDLEAALDEGLVHMLNLTPVELDPDKVAWQIRQVVENNPIKRVAIDGLAELEIACRPQHRSRAFITALLNYFKSQGITILYTHEISKVIGLELDLTESVFSPLAENLLLLKQVEYRAQLYRVLAILKMRDSKYDNTIRQFELTAPGGIKVLEPLESPEGLLGDLARILGQI